MEKFTLTAQLREQLGKQVASLRDNRMIPAVLYGHGVENKNLVLAEPEFRAVFAKAEQSGLIELNTGDGRVATVLVQDVQRNPLTQEVQHVDFYEVKMTEKLTATVSLEFVGESPAENALGGNIVTTQDSVEIECLPKDLVQHLTVDLSKLVEFGDMIRYSDIALPAGVEIVGDADTVVVLVQEPSKVEEEPVVVADVASVEVEKKGKKEDEATAETK